MTNPTSLFWKTEASTQFMLETSTWSSTMTPLLCRTPRS